MFTDNIRLYRLVKHRFFDNCILIVIVISSLKLLADTYFNSEKHYSGSELSFIQLLDTLDYCFNCIFIAELVVKTIANGQCI